MPFDKLVENKIREAMERGEFDDLPGRGKPVDLEAYFAMPEDLRLGHSVLKNAGVVPPGIELLREAEELKGKLRQCGDAGERRRLRKRIDEVMLRFNLLAERRK